LAEGNARFVASTPQHRHAGAARRAEVSQGQNPLAVILACSDSRVPPELLFDQGIGDLFVVRVAGNVVDPHTLGSIEYAIEHLGTQLIVVLGHERCGAVTAARSAVAAGGEAPGNIQSLVAEIAPSVLATAGQSVDATAQANVRHSIERLLGGSALLREAAGNPLQIVAGWYDLDSGEVSFTPGEGDPSGRPRTTD
jgi:carbonic anhydrase